MGFKNILSFFSESEVKNYGTGTQTSPGTPINSQTAINMLIQPYSAAGRFGWTNLRAYAAWKYYKEISVIRDAVDLGADAFSTVPFAVKDHKSGDMLTEYDPRIPATKIMELLCRPNQDISQSDFKKAQYATFSVTGDTFFLTTSSDEDTEPLEIYYINSKNVSETTNHDEIVTTYTVTCGRWRGSYRREELPDGRIVYINKQTKSQQLWIMKSFNPDSYNSGRGLSKLSSIYYEIEQHAGVSKHNNALLRNGVRPSGAVIPNVPEGETSAELSDEQISGLKASIQAFYGGYNNVGNVMVLDGIKEFVELSMNNKDMEFNELMTMVKRQIYNIFNIPLPLKTGENQTFNNFEESKYMLYDMNIIPFATCYADELNRFIMPRLDDSGQYEFVVHKDKIPALEVRKMARLEKFKESVKINELRKVLDYEELEDERGDQLAQPAKVATNGAGKPSKMPSEKDDYKYALMDRGYSENEAEKKAVTLYGCH